VATGKRVRQLKHPKKVLPQGHAATSEPAPGGLNTRERLEKKKGDPRRRKSSAGENTKRKVSAMPPLTIEQSGKKYQ